MKQFFQAIAKKVHRVTGPAVFSLDFTPLVWLWSDLGDFAHRGKWGIR